MSSPQTEKNTSSKPANRSKTIKYDFGIDAEWYKKIYDGKNESERAKIEELGRKASKNNLIAIAIEDWQEDRTHFYEHQDYNAGYVNKIWRGFPSLCDLIEATPLSKKTWGIKPDTIVVNLHFFYSPYDIKAFVCDETLYREICTCLERKRILKTRNRGLKDSPVDKLGNLKTPWFVEKDGRVYQIKLNFVDYSGVAGNAGYDKTCSSYGIKLEDKGLMDEYKSQMNVPYDDPQLRPDFIKYTVGDVKFKQLNKAVLDANNQVRETILKIAKRDKITFTKGSETAKLFLDFMRHKLKNFDKAHIPYMVEIGRNGKHKPPNNIEKIITPSSVKGILNDTLRQLTGQFLAMVMGGRCKNEMPHKSVLKTPIVSMDLKSCYGLALLYAVFPTGRPVILEFDVKDTASWISLKDILNKYESELVPGCWSAVIDTGNSLLPFNQSLFVSNSADKVELKIDFDDSEKVNVNGQVGIYFNQIKNGVLTHHSLQTAKAVMSKVEWGQFIRTVKVKSLAFYPKSLECKTEDELIEKHANHSDNNLKTKITKKFTKTIKDDRCRWWYKFPIGEFVEPLITTRNKLKKERNNYDKDSLEYFNYDSQQELLKLLTNSLYGAISSQYFTISNAVVGNNITDKARCACFVMASTTNGLTSITDGSESPLIRFLKFNKGTSMTTLTGLRFGNISRENKRHIETYSLGKYDWENLKLTKTPQKTLENGKVTGGNFKVEFPCGSSFTTGKSNESWDFISDLYQQHVKDFFSNCRLIPDWVNEFSYEDKGIFKGIAVQSASNYILERYECDRQKENSKIKARGNSLNKKYYSCIEGEYDKEILAPMKQLMEDIYQDSLLSSFEKCQVEQIQKVNDWNNKIATDPNYPILPGETTSRNIRPFPIKSSAFYYPSIEYRRIMERIEQVMETKSPLGLGGLFAIDKQYKYGEVCKKIQHDIINLEPKHFKKHYKNRAEIALGEKLPRLFR